MTKFRSHYPSWAPRYDLNEIIDEVLAAELA
jgi:hypothetical protein